MTLAAYAWGQDGGTYNEDDMRRLADSLFDLPGIVAPAHLLVEQQAVAGPTLKVAAGQVVVSAAGAGLGGKYHLWNDASLNTGSFTPTSGNGRKDRLIVRVNGTTGVPDLHIVEGVASGSPAEPTITEDNYEELALITLPPSTTDVIGAYITDRRRPAFRGGRGYGTAAMLARVAGAGEALQFRTTDSDRLLVHDGTGWKVLDEPWQSYTPTVGGWGIGNGTISARSKRVGDICHTYGEIVAGGTTTFGAALTLSLPYNTVGPTSAHVGILGGATDDSTAVASPLGVYMASSTTVMLLALAGVTQFNNGGIRNAGANVPWTWATNDKLWWRFSYPISAADARA